MSKNSEKKQIKEAVSSFFSEVNRENPDIDKLIDIAKKHPDLLKSDEFIRRAFPKCQKSKLSNKFGLLKTDKLMKTVDILGKMKEKDSSVSQNVDDFMSKNHPGNGENVVTFLAKNAVAAYDKANIDRTPEENLPESDKKILADNYQMYAAQLESIKKSGFDLEVQNEKGQNIFDIAEMSVTKDQTNKTPLSEIELQPKADKKPLKIQEENNGDELEIDGEKKPLKIKTPEKPALKINTEEQIEDKENEGEVVEAPNDRAKPGESKWNPIKEGDIIDYMYNEWFLASLNYVLSKTTGWLEHSVDNLCDDLLKKGAEIREQNAEAKNKRVKDYQKKSADILKNYPSQMTQQFNDGLKSRNGYAKNLNQDIKNNIGKTPQKWNVLNPDNQQDKKLINTLNTQFAENPQEFMQTLDGLDNKNSSSVKAMVKMYDIAVQMATVQYMHKDMKSRKLNLAYEDPKKIKVEIDKLTQGYLKQIMKGVKGVAEHTKLAYMIRDGEQDMGFINENSAIAVNKYLEVLSFQTATAKADLLTDLESGKFKANGPKSTTKASENVKKMNAIVGDGEKYYDALIPAKKKAKITMGLEEEAKNINVTDIRNGNIRDGVLNTVKDLEFQKASSDERKNAFKKYVENMKNNKDFMNQDQRATNPKEVVASIIASRQQKGNG